jgi:hypothetical protein
VQEGQQQGGDGDEESGGNIAERSSKYDADTAVYESENSVLTSSENEDGDDENSSVEGVCPSSNNDNNGGSCTADPRNPVFPASMYVGDVLLASSSTPAMMRGKANKIGRAMHEGDDEGRPSAKRVKRPPPPPADEEDDNEQELHGILNNSSRQMHDDACDDDDDDDDGGGGSDDTEEEYDDDDGGEDRGSESGTHTPSQNAHRSQSQVAPTLTRSRHSARISTNLQRASANGGPIDRAAGVGNAASIQHQPEPRRPPPRPPRVRVSKCWLCTFANSKMAKQVSSFVSANAGCMDPTIMADQIKCEVTREVGVYIFLDVSGSKTEATRCVRVLIYF